MPVRPMQGSPDGEISAMKPTDHGTTPDTEPKHAKPAQPARAKARNRKDGRDNPAQLHENQRALGVGEDHRTEKMKQKRRGTFP